MEKEVFSTEVQVRRIGERRYGKGTLKITDKNLHLNYKKFLSKRQIITIPRNQIAKTEFRNVEGPFEIIGPAPQNKWSWVIFTIISLIIRQLVSLRAYEGQVFIVHT